jgi:excisionase family DNA binding protein
MTLADLTVRMTLADLTGPDAPATITVEQTAELLGIGRKTAYESIRRGEIPGVLHLGRRVLISVPAMITFLNGGPA